MGRWWSVDPLAEKMQTWSPYNYVFDNPIMLVDPDGRAPGSGDEDGQKGIIRSSTEFLKKSDPIAANVIDVSYFVAEITGMNAIDDAIATIFNPNASTSSKIESAAVAIMSTPGENPKLGPKSKFGAGENTVNVTSREAFRNAKDQLSVPRSSQPTKTIKSNTPMGNEVGLDKRNGSMFEFKNSKGENVYIRKDKPASYNDGGKGDQGPHYNAGPKSIPMKLNQHHNYLPKM